MHVRCQEYFVILINHDISYQFVYGHSERYVMLTEIKNAISHSFIQG